MVEKQCLICNKAFQVIPARAETARVCSNECRYRLQETARLGALNGRWKGGDRVKLCQHCGKEFCWNGVPFVAWQKRKFCSKPCFVAGQKRLRGEAHPRHNPNASARSKERHGLWSAQIMARDNYTCGGCGKRGGELHAHHIKPWKTHPELRNELSNGITLCVPCHHEAHGYKENRVNSVKRQTGQYRANPHM
jgi:hypothetical protein